MDICRLVTKWAYHSRSRPIAVTVTPPNLTTIPRTDHHRRHQMMQTTSRTISTMTYKCPKATMQAKTMRLMMVTLIWKRAYHPSMRTRKRSVRALPTRTEFQSARRPSEKTNTSRQTQSCMVYEEVYDLKIFHLLFLIMLTRVHRLAHENSEKL